MNNRRLITASLRTDIGQIRDHNEDFFIFQEPANDTEASRNGWLYIVADGVGGADAGEVASRFASEQTLAHYLQNDTQENPGQRLVDAMQSANTDLRRMVAERNNNSRMATTMVGVVITGGKACIANVGDSRCYLWRKGSLEQVTKDQSLVAKLLEEGAITPEEAENHPRRNVILYSLGSERSPKIDLYERFLEPDDRLLLCSDGLTRHVTDKELALYLADDALDEATQSLVNLANNRGGQDNITAVILHFHGDGVQKSVSPQSDNGAATAVIPKPQPAQKSLWGFTIFLTIIQICLIIVLWAILFA
jgi:protein phosphatase